MARTIEPAPGQTYGEWASASNWVASGQHASSFYEAIRACFQLAALHPHLTFVPFARVKAHA
ncbi:hypothetical protein Afil01_69360 [Actinorhabdospora filicis]|uniref:Uncharacterized protein n=2 Tax=Actinorhabdospora filicis TaxID=1785913 RepID=A0A9W6WD02_9ACTN|nr:hypothetical protein Afil01_69360 [Actinorhabdospora filicis]